MGNDVAERYNELCKKNEQIIDCCISAIEQIKEVVNETGNDELIIKVSKIIAEELRKANG